MPYACRYLLMINEEEVNANCPPYDSERLEYTGQETTKDINRYMVIKCMDVLSTKE